MEDIKSTQIKPLKIKIIMSKKQNILDETSGILNITKNKISELYNIFFNIVIEKN